MKMVCPPLTRPTWPRVRKRDQRQRGAKAMVPRRARGDNRPDGAMRPVRTSRPSASSTPMMRRDLARPHRLR